MDKEFALCWSLPCRRADAMTGSKAMPSGVKLACRRSGHHATDSQERLHVRQRPCPAVGPHGEGAAGLQGMRCGIWADLRACHQTRGCCAGLVTSSSTPGPIVCRVRQGSLMSAMQEPRRSFCSESGGLAADQAHSEVKIGRWRQELFQCWCLPNCWLMHRMLQRWAVQARG